jgi:hypothetical protein
MPTQRNRNADHVDTVRAALVDAALRVFHATTQEYSRSRHSSDYRDACSPANGDHGHTFYATDSDYHATFTGIYTNYRTNQYK